MQTDEATVTIAAAASGDQSGAPAFGAESDRLDEALAAARRRLGQERYGAARRRGRQLHPDEAVSAALAAIADLADPQP